MKPRSTIALHVAVPERAKCDEGLDSASPLSPKSCESYGSYGEGFEAVEGLREALRQEWLQFRDALDQAAMQQFNRQEELLAQCLASLPCADSPVGCESMDSTVYVSQEGDEGEDVMARQTTGRRRSRRERTRRSHSFESPTKLQDMIQSAKDWKSENSVWNKKTPSSCTGFMNWCSSLQEPPRTGLLAVLTKSKPFETLCVSVIVVNAALSAVAVNHEVGTLSTGGTPFLRGVEFFFVTFYTVELALKLAVHRLYYFCNSEMNWNIFDAVLVAFSLFDQALTIAMASSDSGADFTFMRTLRILKMARVLRGLRVLRFFSELRLMLNSLLGSLSSLMWSILMLALIFYIFGLVFVQGVANHLIDSGAEADTVMERYWRTMNEFGSVQLAVLSLFKACTGGDDWKYFLWAIEPAGAMYAGLFLFFVAFSQIALLNILTAIFVQRAMKLAQPDRETQAMIERAKEIEDLEELRRVIHEADYDGNGRLSVSEFCKHIKRGKLGAQMAALGLNVKNAPVFFGLVAQSFEEDEVEVNDFAERCMRMRGLASCIDVSEANMQLDSIQQAQQELHTKHARLEFLITDLMRARDGEAGDVCETGDVCAI